MFHRCSSTLFPSWRHSIRAGLVLAVACTLAGCQDEPRDLITASGAPLQYTGTYNPALTSEVRSTPVIVAPGRTYRFWHRIQNTSPENRSYWVWGYEGSAALELVGRTPDFSLAAGESRWVYVDMRVNQIPENQRDVQLYFDAHDMQGDTYGFTRSILPVQVSKSLPAVGFVSENYTDHPYGETHQNVYPGEIKTVRVRVANPLGAAHTICTLWLDDEGLHGQTTRPQPTSRCEVVGANDSTEFNFAYRVSPGASAGTLDRQVLQVYSLADPNAVVYGSLKTTTVATPTVVSAPGGQAFRRFYAWTNYQWKSTLGNIALQIQDVDTRQDRQYVQFIRDSLGQLGFTTNPQPVGCDSACVMQFARNNPGRLYIVADEPAQLNVSPYNYAKFYGRVVQAIRNEDPTARFSPAGFEQQNGQSDAYPLHGTDYAQSFLTNYRSIYRVDPPVAEWRFHYLEITDMTQWQDTVAARAKWAKDHGAPLVLGSFGFPETSWQNLSSEAASGYMQNTMFPSIKNQAWLNGHSTPFGVDPALEGWIISAVWYGYDIGPYHQLCCTSSGDLQLEGYKFAENQY